VRRLVDRGGWVVVVHGGAKVAAVDEAVERGGRDLHRE